MGFLSVFLEKYRNNFFLDKEAELVVYEFLQKNNLPKTKVHIKIKGPVLLISASPPIKQFLLLQKKHLLLSIQEKISPSILSIE